MTLAFALAAVACDDPCDPNHCEGNTLHYCVNWEGEPQGMESQQCDRCVEQESEAFCAQPDASLDAACDPQELFSHACADDETGVHCRGGTAIVAQTCDEGRTCVHPSGPLTSNYCVESTELDPRCGDSWEYSFCDNGLIRSCAYGYLLSRMTDCGAPNLCAEYGAETFCVVSSTPDPRCQEHGGSQCSGDSVIECKLGYLTFESACAKNERCVDTYGSGVYCAERD